MHNSTIKKVQFEIGQIDNLLDKYKILIDLLKTKKPDDIELAAIASVLHAFYNGIENIFLLIAKSIDKKVPSGIKWHRDLLKHK